MTMQEIYENNVRRQYTEADGQHFTEAEKALADKGLDVFGPGANQNLALIDAFFQNNRQVPVNLENIYRAIEGRKSEFIWLSQAQADWYRTAQQNPDLANSLAAHLAAQGRHPGQLISDGSDAHFENLLLLFNELNNRRETASVVAIANAENRIAHRLGRQLQRVPQPRRTEPTSHAAKNDNGQPFLGSDMVKNPDGSWRNKTHAEFMAEKRAAEEASQPGAQQALSKEEAQWKTMAEDLLRYGSHANQAAIKTVHDQEIANNSSWRQVFEAVNKVVADFKRRATVSGHFR
jgi:hypothetical protein